MVASGIDLSLTPRGDGFLIQDNRSSFLIGTVRSEESKTRSRRNHCPTTRGTRAIEGVEYAGVVEEGRGG